MDYSLLVWLLPTLALVAGVIIGFLVARLVPSAAPSSTQRQLDEVQERLDTYQNEVASHFSTTANLVQKLSQSYQEVQQHLADSANRLATDELTRQRLLAALHPESSSAPVRDRLSPTLSEPPKDYAPKAGNSPGMLDEQYGLKR